MSQFHRGAAAGATALLLTLTACSTATAPGGGGEGDVLTLAIDTPELLEPVVEAFREAHPEIEAEVLPIGSTGYMQFMQTQLASGTAPDVFMVYPGTGEPMTNKKLGERDLIRELSGDWIEQVPEDTRALLEGPDGAVNTVPGQIAGIGITYNVVALEAIGGQPAASFDGLLALCAQAVEHDTRLFSAGQKDAWVGQIIPWAIAVPKLYADDPDLNDRLMNGETTYAETGWVEVFQQVEQLIAADCFSEGSTGIGYEEAQNLAADGEVVATINYGDMTQMTGLAPEDTEFIFTAFPAGAEGDPQYMPITPAKGFAINADTDNLEAAETFIDFMTRSCAPASSARSSTRRATTSTTWTSGSTTRIATAAGRSGGAQRAFRPCSTRRTRSAACSARSRGTPRA